MSAIVCDHLRREYRSRRKNGPVTVAIDDLDLVVEPGQIFGLLGPNGAGKTTLIKVLTTLLSPTAGTATVAGFDVARQGPQVRRHIGFVFGGDRGLYFRLSGRDNLLYFAALYGLGRAEANERATRLLGVVGLDSYRNRRVEQYSRGMRQRLHVARGLLTDPDVLFLDEPTIGLDPEGARELRTIVSDLRQEARTVLLTSHYMVDIDLLCDRVAIINSGRILLDGTIGEMRAAAPQVEVIEIEVGGAAPNVEDAIQALPTVQAVSIESLPDRARISVNCNSAATILDSVLAIVRSEAPVLASYIRTATLEDAYVALLSQARANARPEMVVAK
jgi:ABC-2 type transport system ATP-binding protein